MVIGFRDPLPGNLAEGGKNILGGKMTERSNASGLARYWPVLVAVAVLAAVLVTAQVLRGGDAQQASSEPGAGSAAASDGTPPALKAFPGVDPLSAPDCDRDTGRLEVASLLAPNCVPVWPAGRDNGGATTQGVTATEITVAVYTPQQTAQGQATLEATGTPNLPPEETNSNRDKVAKVYDDLYETYGRRIKLVPLPAGGGNNDDAAAKSDAIRAATEIKAFAVIGGPTGTNAFVDELVARKVICLCTVTQPQVNYERWAPYVFAYQMSSTQGYIHRADMVKALNGKPAEFGGDDVKTKPRKFGILYSETTDNAYKAGVDFFEERLQGMGITLAARVPNLYDSTRAAEDSRTIVARFKDAGVTSVIFAASPLLPQYVSPEATAQNYFPEWILTGSALLDSAAVGRLFDARQWRHAFGITFGVARIEPTYIEQEGNIVSWHLGEELTSYPNILDIGRLATGVHLAGPDLTVETFRDGLFSFKPTANNRTSPAVSMGKTDRWPFTDYTVADDVTLLWWDPDTRGPSETGVQGNGMFRYVDEGKRYLPGQLANADFSKMFKPENTSVLLAERPAEDRPPDYPRRKAREG
jgi:hypothetical protein